MKYRLGFVTNSSSSGFIVAHKLMDVAELKGIPEEAKIILESFYDSYFSNTVKTEEEIEQYIKDVYGYDSLEEALDYDREYITRIIETLKKKIQEGYVVSEFWYEYGDMVGPRIIETLVRKGYAEVLENM